MIETSIRLSIQRMPAKKCNHAIRRKSLAKIIDHGEWKILFIIDSESRGREAVHDIIDHFNSKELDRIRVVIIDPRHEKWLCLGLGGKHNQCFSKPEDAIIRILKNKGLGIKYYSKDMLKRHVDQINIEYLYGEQDFKEYLQAIEWLEKDP